MEWLWALKASNIVATSAKRVGCAVFKTGAFTSSAQLRQLPQARIANGQEGAVPLKQLT